VVPSYWGITASYQTARKFCYNREMKIVKAVRTQKTINKYLKFIKYESFKYKCGLCREKSVKEFKYWRIVRARFPLDKIARVNHILLPKRHVRVNKLTGGEKKEFESIKKNYLKKKYDVILEAMPKSQSIPGHHHLHLLVWKI
jgi:hypothetical protein